eukprot:1159183-Pelagomonas_calceolata.AAC.35
MMKIGGPQITLLASDHPKTAHSSTLGPTFTPQNMFHAAADKACSTQMEHSTWGSQVSKLPVTENMRGEHAKNRVAFEGLRTVPASRGVGRTGKSDQTGSPCPGYPKTAEYHLLLAKLKHPFGQVTSAEESIAEAQVGIDEAGESDWAAAHKQANRNKARWERSTQQRLQQLLLQLQL